MTDNQRSPVAGTPPTTGTHKLSWLTVVLPVVVLTALITLAGTAGKSGDVMLSTDDPADAAQLSRHLPDNRINQHAPTLAEVTRGVAAEHRFIVMHDDSGNADTADSRLAFFKARGLSASRCSYRSRTACDFGERTTLVASLGDMSAADIVALTEVGIDILAYGIPADTTRGSTLVPGLRFIDDAGHVVTELAVLTDRVATIGIDAGLSMPVTRSHQNVRVESDHAQAIAMTTRVPDGRPLDARVHAAPLGRARLVWMDFSLADTALANDEQQHYIDALLAGMLRYLTRQPIHGIATYPAGPADDNRVARGPLTFPYDEAETAGWWQARETLLQGGTLTDHQLDRYRPQQLGVDEAGSLTRHDITPVAVERLAESDK